MNWLSILTDTGWFLLCIGLGAGVLALLIWMLIRAIEIAIDKFGPPDFWDIKL